MLSVYKPNEVLIHQLESSHSMLMMPLPSYLLPIANKLLHLLGSVALSPTHKKKFLASNCTVYQGTDPSKEYANYAYSFFILGYVVAKWFWPPI
jgi:hypothetical protein